MFTNTTSILPVSQTAIIQDENGAPKLANGVPLPLLRDGTVMIKTVAVALNPSDNKMGTTFPTPGAIIGMDFSGIIVSIHSNTQTELRIGDRVCGAVHGSNPSEPTNGAFAQYIRARPELLFHVPRDLTMEQAATLGVGLMTNVLALWDPEALGLVATPESPAEKPFPVLVYGGSTATGTIATQLLRMSGLEPIVTCSPRNFELVQAYGAGSAIDYVRPDVAEEIKKRTNGKLKYAYDCIADSVSVRHCYTAIGRTGGRYVSLEILPEELRTRRAVHAKFVLGYEGFGEDVALSKGYESSANPEKFALIVKYCRIFQRFLDENALKTHPIQQLNGGLTGVLHGLQLLKSGSVSGKKLVATL
ncbi:zinc-binding dehydrogenase family oxidoreductase [Annulohypoxylon truncatum]|uniref:zinc-binding dehydrogenase family oxidoreductase n=1 Tax=Annulohypoxylon truncatum TaxID=327061 RepID=UPI00200773E3|nr:zinc-binding dehydrogenase family oxidoreductase [Annulohypoxylon truncatum]KAI1209523.1 zinc-binding dehydrogenase family oxidoreductase [Annulohypoxylon truncatum]